MAQPDLVSPALILQCEPLITLGGSAGFYLILRRFKAVMGVLDAMIQYGVSLSRSVKHTAQWDRILAAGLLCPVTLGDLGAVQGLGIGEFHRVVSDIHHRLSDFIHTVVVHRRDDAIREGRERVGRGEEEGGGIGFGRIPLFTRSCGMRLMWCPCSFSPV